MGSFFSKKKYSDQLLHQRVDFLGSRDGSFRNAEGGLAGSEPYGHSNGRPCSVSEKKCDK